MMALKIDREVEESCDVMRIEEKVNQEDERLDDRGWDKVRHEREFGQLLN